MEVGCIYYIYCKETNKGYVGLTIDLDFRIREHFADKDNCILHKAMRKYGREAFTIETLCVVPIEALPRMEEYWAEQLETYIWDSPGGYNMVWCGKKGFLGLKHSEETKKKMSDAHTGKQGIPHSEETKKRLSETHKGVKKSEEMRKKLSEIAKARWAKSNWAKKNQTLL